MFDYRILVDQQLWKIEHVFTLQVVLERMYWNPFQCIGNVLERMHQIFLKGNWRYTPSEFSLVSEI